MPAETEMPRPYNNVQIRLHWLVAILIGLQWWAGESMHEVMQVLEKQGNLGFGQFLVSTLHSFGGLLILVLVFWRLRLKFQRGPVSGPSPTQGQPPVPVVFQRIARLNHHCLYALLGLMVISGSLSYYEVLPASEFHSYCAAALKILVFLHILAALYHHFVRKDHVLASMWFDQKQQ